MKKFKIENAGKDTWLVSHNEFPKFTCLFEDKRFNYKRTITGLSDPSGDPEQIQLLQKMEKWLKQHHKGKIDV
ncbi:hypothetical protein [Flavobacterium phragmitis]|uniref:hypothetical protein n=1 Tax=Flavobacterium phragmitis TaxID=739143 RepID=UPI001160A1B1|nr:hypothetical protein [Flavobacterium phragmitis]